jgi:DASS family divalent anion:Na+ symporter
MNLQNRSLLALLFSTLLAAAIWSISPPAGVTALAWQLWAIFLGTIVAIVLDALPMGACTLMGLTAAVLTHTLTFSEAFWGFQNEVVWLILTAFFVAHGFIQTGLGRRIAYYFIVLLGKSTLGLGFGIAITEVLLAPAIPSLTARSGAIVYPIAQSLAETLGSRPKDGTARRAGAYLIMVALHTAVVSSAMFLTAMAANPLAAKLAEKVGVYISWWDWTKAALVPGLATIALLPLVLFKLFPPELKDASRARHAAKEKLESMGSMTRKEGLMLLTFVGLLLLWTVGAQFKISAAISALLGVSFMVVTRIVTWDELIKISGAWETFIWFGALLSLAEGMNTHGLATWFGEYAAQAFATWPWLVASAALFFIYFYSHYFFASGTAHVGALFLPFVLVSTKLGAPPLATALLFAQASNLMGCLTHYGCGPAPILYGSGYVTLKQWWGLGLVVSVFTIAMWLGIGLPWWKLIGII